MIIQYFPQIDAQSSQVEEEVAQHSSALEKLECVVQDCPQVLRKGATIFLTPFAVNIYVSHYCKLLCHIILVTRIYRQ